MSPKGKEFTERINVFFSPEQMEQIKAEAYGRGLTVSAYVRMIVMREVAIHPQELVMEYEEKMAKMQKCINELEQKLLKESEIFHKYL